MSLWERAHASSKLGRSGLVVSISDIHFDPFYDPKLVPALIQSDYTSWRMIFAGSAVQGYGSHKADTNYQLLNSALENIYARAHTPDFIVISGDFLAHDFQDTYAQATGTNDAKAVNSFIDKTIAFVTWMIARRFPNTPVYPALGNNDSHCGDYNLEPAGEFLRTTAQTWKSLLRNTSNSKSFMQTFPLTGSYSVIAPQNLNHRVIVLNTTFFSNNYKNKCGDPSADPGREEMKWLESELAKAAAANARVWLVYHIPAGIDVFATVKQKQPVALWRDSFNQQFLDLVTQNSKVIVAAFAGHFHMDSFQLMRTANQSPVSFVHITPGISPLFGNNPAFDVFTYNRKSATLQDYTAYYFDLGSPAAKKNAPVRWSKEYSFALGYGQPSFSAASLNAIYSQMLTNNKGALTRYRNLLQRQ